VSDEGGEAEPGNRGPWDRTVENAVLGLPTLPVALAPPLDDFAATLIGASGRGWNGSATGTPVLVPFSFATRDSSHYPAFGTASSDGFVPGTSEAFDSAQRGAALEALKLWEEVSGLTFVEVPDAPTRWSGGIRFLLENLPAGVLGQATSLLPSGAEIIISRGHFADHPMQPGSPAFWTLLHEIGHAVGLKHPFAEGPVLPTIHDNTVNTVMSYTDLGNHSRLGPFDIAAVQHLYGADAAEATLAVRWSRGPGGMLVSTGNDAANTITGLGIGDLVRAGGGADAINTEGGNDVILPGTGADTVDGGAGFDTVWAEAPRRHAVLAEQGGGARTLALPGGTDRLSSVETIRFSDGHLAFDAGLPAGQVFRLYGAALDRPPDPIGFGQWVQAVEHGTLALEDAAAGFVGAAEFAARFGAPNDAGFAVLLYGNVLGRAPDAAGLAYWTEAMAAGLGRAGALLGFSESAEYKQRTASTYAAGLWVPDPEAVDVLRAYAAVLDRMPDAEGLAAWTAAREAGLGQSELIGHFVQSAEFQARFGGLSDRRFVEQLYRTALDREADPEGAAAWTGALDAGLASRAGVALGFAGSVEMTVKLTPFVADGILLA
jgi:serralysin